MRQPRTRVAGRQDGAPQGRTRGRALDEQLQGLHRPALGGGGQLPRGVGHAHVHGHQVKLRGGAEDVIELQVHVGHRCRRRRQPTRHHYHHPAIAADRNHNAPRRLLTVRSPAINIAPSLGGATPPCRRWRQASGIFRPRGTLRRGSITADIDGPATAARTHRRRESCLTPQPPQPPAVASPGWQQRKIAGSLLPWPATPVRSPHLQQINSAVDKVQELALPESRGHQKWPQSSPAEDPRETALPQAATRHRPR